MRQIYKTVQLMNGWQPFVQRKPVLFVEKIYGNVILSGGEVFSESLFVTNAPNIRLLD